MINTKFDGKWPAASGEDFEKFQCIFTLQVFFLLFFSLEKCFPSFEQN
jgi:hypothetical protein